MCSFSMLLFLSGLDGNLHRATAVHLVKRRLIILELKYIRDLYKTENKSVNTMRTASEKDETYHALDVDLAAIQVGYRAGEAEGL